MWICNNYVINDKLDIFFSAQGRMIVNEFELNYIIYLSLAIRKKIQKPRKNYKPSMHKIIYVYKHTMNAFGNG